MSNDTPAGATPPDDVWAQPTMRGSGLSPGMELGRFRVEELIARGGMGEVWKALDPARQRPVVVKVLPSQFQNNPQEITRIQQSFQRVNALQHQHICPVYDLGEDPHCGHYLVMKYVEGETLAVYHWKYVKQHGSFPSSEVLRVLQPIALALDYAHQQKVIHRDIKPQNILVHPDGSDPQLVDFGLAAEIHLSVSRVSMEKTDTSGTYPYMAPEQWRGQRQDSKADQYSLAVVVYELLSGNPPFTAADTAVLRLCVLEESVPPIANQPESVNAALARALAKDPAERFASCEKFMASLGAAKSSPSPPPSATSASPTVPKPHSSTSTELPPSATMVDDKCSPPSSTAMREKNMDQKPSSPSTSRNFTLVLLAVVVVGAVILWKDPFTKKTSVTSTPAPASSSASTTTPNPPSASPTPNPSPSATTTTPKTAPQTTPHATPPLSNPQDEHDAAMEQLNANQAKNNAVGCDAEHCAPAEWKIAQKTMAAADAHFSKSEFLKAKNNYRQAAHQYLTARVEAEKIYRLRTNAVQAQRDMIAAREGAVAYRAEKLSPTRWALAEKAKKSAEADHQKGLFKLSREKYIAATHAYIKAKDEAMYLDRANKMREKFNTEIVNPGKDKLDKYGGPPWTDAMKAIAESEASRDPMRIVESYEHALNILPDARELASDPEPTAPATSYKMELKAANRGTLPKGWRAQDGIPNMAAITVTNGLTVLTNQAPNQPAIIESPPMRLKGDFFVQIDTLCCMTPDRLDVTLIANRSDREITYSIQQQPRGIMLSLLGAAPRPIRFDRLCPLSYRIERKGTTFSLFVTGYTSEIVALKVPQATIFKGIRLTFNKNVMRLTGMRTGPLKFDSSTSNTVPFVSAQLPGPNGTDQPSPGGRHRIRVSGLSINKNFAVEFMVKWNRQQEMFFRLIGKDGAHDFPLVLNNGHPWTWHATFPQGNTQSTRTPNHTRNNRFRIERIGTMYHVLVDGQEIGQQQVVQGLGSFEALELMDLREPSQLSSLKVKPLP